MYESQTLAQRLVAADQLANRSGFAPAALGSARASVPAQNGQRGDLESFPDAQPTQLDAGRSALPEGVSQRGAP